MKKWFPVLFGLVILMACNNTHQKTKYNLKQNDWRNDKLNGKVKTLIQYKANVINFKNGETEKPRIEFQKEYTKFGMISFQESYDNFKELKQKTKNEYNEKGLRVKSITQFYQPNLKMVQTNKFDTAGRIISSSLVDNDTMALSTRLEYNSHGDIKKSIVIKNGNSDTVIFKYKYDTNGHVLLKKQIQENKSNESEHVIISKYDETGNLTEEINKSETFGEIKWAYKYDSINGLEKNTEYQNGQIQQETYFDKNRNQTLVKYYDNGELNREMRFEYTFDKTGNWNVRKAFFKQNFAKDKKFIPVYVETRKIEYYK